MASDPDDSASSEYVAFVKDLVDAEDIRRANLESRGAGVITSSGALVTLLLGFVALVSSQDDFALEPGAATLLNASAVAFVLAAVLAITTYTPRATEIVDANELKRELHAIWGQDVDYARIIITSTRLGQLGDLQRSNDARAWLLLAAVITEVIAVLILGAAVLVLI